MFNFSDSKGYTIIEILSVTFVLAVVGVVIAGILASILRGTNKTKIASVVAQNGNYAASVITDIINSSDKILKIDGSTAISTFCKDSPPKASSITLRRMDSGETTISCDLVNDRIASTSSTFILAPLTNKDEVVFDRSVPSYCYITCKQLGDNPYAVPLIEVGFSLKEAKGSFLENKASASFKTSVMLRNFKDN